MRTTKLITALLAVAALVSSCKQDEDYVLPSLKVSSELLDFSSGSEQSLGIVATRDWMVKSKPEWVAIDPDHGTSSTDPQWVTVTALPNDSYDRTAELVFTIGLAKSTVTLQQPGALGPVSHGSGTLEDPYTVAGAVEYVSSLPADTETTSNIYIKGKVSSVTEEFGAQFGNATFYIQDEGSDVTFYVFRTLYLGNAKWKTGDKQIAVGDEVVICGLVVNYRGNTPETVINKSFVYSLNGESSGGGGDTPGGGGTPAGSGTQADPYNVAAAISAVANLTWTSNEDYQTTDEVYVKGKISRIPDKGTYGESGTFGNATFFISDDGTQSNELQAYRILYLGNKKYTSGTDIKAGDEVVICGKLMNYRGNTPETVANAAYLYSLNGSSEGGSGGGGDTPSDPGTPSGSGTLASPYNVAAARDAVKNLTWTSNDDYQTTDEVYVKGKISQIAAKGTYGESGTFGNATFYISDDGTQSNELQAYRILYLGNKKYTSGTDIKAGDEVVICGKLMNYRGNTPETVANAAYLYSLNGSSEGGSGGGDTPSGGDDTPSDPGTPSGDGSQASPYNAAAAAAAVKNLTWTSNTDYQKTDPVYVKGKISKIAKKGTFTEAGEFGNATFYISDDGKESGTQFYVFRTLYLGNKKYESGKTDIKVGDEVVIYGPLMNYQGNTPETEANKTYLYSLNGKTE